jgi:branched-chain amino acid transport system permease protein
MVTFVLISSSALQLAVVYWIVNLGFVYLYRMTGVLNFAQGQMVMLGAFMLAFASQSLGLSLFLAVPLVLVVSAIFGILVYVASMRYLHGAGDYTKVIATFMISVILTEIVGLIWGINSYILPLPQFGFLHIGGAVVPRLTLYTAGALLILIAIVQYLITHARWGVAMRATASNGALATYYGIRNVRLGAAAWAVAFVCATLGGLIYAEGAPVVAGMSSVGFVAFPAAVLGGMDSVPGAIAGGAIVAAVEAVTSFYVGGSIADAASFALVIAVLVVKPSGLLGKSRSVRL